MYVEELKIVKQIYKNTTSNVLVGHSCVHYCCCGRSRSRSEGQERSGVGHVTSNGALPITSESGETLTMTSSRSYNTLCSDNRRQDGTKSKWNTNGYRATSRSTDDIMEDMKRKIHACLT